MADQTVQDITRTDVKRVSAIITNTCEGLKQSRGNVADWNIDHIRDTLISQIKRDMLKPGPVSSWTVHVVGPDDVIPQGGELEALREANKMNKVFAKMERTENDPFIIAIATDEAP